VLPSETPAHAFADDKAFQAAVAAGAITPGSVVAAGMNFGCGSSREQAASCLKGHELTIVARSFARIFLQNAINLGLKVILAPSFEADEGDEIVFEEGRILDLTSNRGFEVEPLPKARQAIIDAGGLVPYTRARFIAAQSAGGAPRGTSPLL
ncbi:MAG TPA: 3-isopropylmalate dehydratase small subunit, partial [Thermoanaerobaculia bacterium]|nr:3-isopropylmalate dehydratase small subunit [Thermoanaerobaculia bacterium]